MNKPPHRRRGTEHKDQRTKSDRDDNSNSRNRNWTHDKPMFWVTLAGVVAVLAYTTVAAWQGWLMSGQLSEMQRSTNLSQRAFVYFEKVEFPVIDKAAPNAVLLVECSHQNGQSGGS
jgi:hypothetical protein